MAAPEPILRLCLLVSYPNGFASPTGSPPNIGVYALVDPADENDPGIRMRVERCTGSGCTVFEFRGTSNGLAFTSPTPAQAEFVDTAAYGTIYRYRARMENDDGVSAYSAEVEIDTTTHGTSGCSGAGSDPGPGIPPATGAARQFNGVGDRLNTGLHLIKGSTNNFSVYAWIKKTVGTGGTILGVIHQYVSNNRLEFKAALTNTAQVPRLLLEIECSGIPTFRAIDTVAGPIGNVAGNPYWYNKSFFVAFVNDGPSGRARFFWGLTADSIIEVDITDFTTATSPTFITEQWTDPLVTLNIGATGREGQSNGIDLVAEDFFPGIIDSVGLEFDTVLTLDQLKQRAQCGLGAGNGAGRYYWPINGTDPEPGITEIIGTTVVPGICQQALGTDQVQELALQGIVEYTLSEVQELALQGIVEYWGSPADMPSAGPGDIEPGGSGPNTGPDPDRFDGPNPPPYVDGSGNKNIFIYYSHTYDFLKDPLDITRHDSFELDFGWERWKFIRRLWVTGTSAGAVRVDIWIDEVLRYSGSIVLTTPTSSGWARERLILPATCMKGKLFRFVFSSMAPFKLFDAQVEWHPLSGERGYSLYPVIGTAA